MLRRGAGGSVPGHRRAGAGFVRAGQVRAQAGNALLPLFPSPPPPQTSRLSLGSMYVRATPLAILHIYPRKGDGVQLCHCRGWIGVGMSSQQQCSRALLKVR